MSLHIPYDMCEALVLSMLSTLSPHNSGKVKGCSALCTLFTNGIQWAQSSAESTEVKMNFDIWFRGHLVIAWIRVYDAFNFT